MKIADPAQDTVVDEVSLVLAELPFAGASVLELGCGKAEKTRMLAETGRLKEVVALDLNEVFRLFHDEKIVREAAFAAIRNAVDDGRLNLEKQLFFNVRSFFESFDQFDQRMIQVTHTNH
jgi:SAM-dependent methyltransferase